MIDLNSVEMSTASSSNVCNLASMYKPFANRESALKELITLLPTKEMSSQDWVVLAISSGGVYFADALAKKTNSEFDFLFTESIPAPNNKECDVAMVSETEEIVINDHLVNSFEINLDYIYGEAKRKHEDKILSYIYKYRKGDHLTSLKDKKVLIVDEGIDTGMTLMCAIKTVLQMKAVTISVATPVMPTDVFNNVDLIIDNLYCIHVINKFIDVGFYYKELEELSYDDIIKITKSEK
jgi:putative phosphoribosyl transferase